MRSHPEVARDSGAMQARLESPRRFYATPGLRPGGLAPSDGGSSRRSTVMRLGPAGQPAHSRVIRRRSRPIRVRPRRLKTFALRSPARRARRATPLGARLRGGGPPVRTHTLLTESRGGASWKDDRLTDNP